MSRALLLCFAVIVVGGCNLSSLEDPIVVPEVNDEFYLDLWERLAPTGRFLEWKLRTIENAECQESSLDYTYRTTSGTLKLDINEIIIPADCTPGEQPLLTTIEGVQLATDFYPLSFSLRDAVTNDGSLLVSTQKYTVDFQDPSGIVLIRKELNRIPDQTIWGYIYPKADSLTEAADQFVDQLADISSLKILDPGYYGYFIADDTGKITFNNNEAPSGARTFTYTYTGEEEALTQLVEETRENYTEDIDLKIFDTRGKVY